jgi:hypothetical protein
MAITVDWATRIISVPQSYLVNVTGTLYELDTNAFRLDLKDIEDSEEGAVFPDTHRHNTTVTVAGTTFARTIEIINGYSVEFEDGAYSVRLVGSNNNIFDVQNGILVQNQVQVIAQNSAGLIEVATGAGPTPTQVATAVWNELVASHTDLTTLGGIVRLQYLLAHNRVITDPSTGVMTVYADDDVTPLYTAAVWEDAAGTQAYQGSGAERRDKLT